MTGSSISGGPDPQSLPLWFQIPGNRSLEMSDSGSKSEREGTDIVDDDGLVGEDVVKFSRHQSETAMRVGWGSGGMRRRWGERKDTRRDADREHSLLPLNLALLKPAITLDASTTDTCRVIPLLPSDMAAGQYLPDFTTSHTEHRTDTR